MKLEPQLVCVYFTAPSRMYLINAIVCMEHNTGTCPPARQSRPSLCPLEAAPDHVGRRGATGSSRGGSDGYMTPSHCLERGTWICWNKERGMEEWCMN